MKRVTLGALDYGVSFSVDRTLRQLLERGRLSAVGCLVASDLWSREFKPLQEVVDGLAHRALTGVTLAFSGDRVRPLSVRMRATYGDVMPAASKWAHRSMLRLLPDELLKEEAEAQIRRYSDLMGRAPDLVAVRDGLLAHPAIARIVTDAVRVNEGQTLPVLISPTDVPRLQNRLVKHAAKAGLKVLPKGPSLPETSDPERLHLLLKRHFDGLADMSFVASIPGRADNRLRRDEPRDKIAIRECQREVLSSQRFFQTLVEKDVYLH
ncbi:hypothetical protein GCM10011316_25980 [Roseibium aquae]|uniref:YdjC-like protein n=1 Tax=Roseibium aquae TaxID=1323746 RepID=A0A916TLB1_9HYPH|nr:ChbG/HpnK family deacetylase [Roseibium aquae]GGB52745.1 hypothetical protein GCM10011316_25980 [Roseibium aquae]